MNTKATGENHLIHRSASGQNLTIYYRLCKIVKRSENKGKGKIVTNMIELPHRINHFGEQHPLFLGAVCAGQGMTARHHEDL